MNEAANKTKAIDLGFQGFLWLDSALIRIKPVSQILFAPFPKIIRRFGSVFREDFRKCILMSVS